MARLHLEARSRYSPIVIWVMDTLRYLHGSIYTYRPAGCRERAPINQYHTYHTPPRPPPPPPKKKAINTQKVDNSVTIRPLTGYRAQFAILNSTPRYMTPPPHSSTTPTPGRPWAAEPTRCSKTRRPSRDRQSTLVHMTLTGREVILQGVKVEWAREEGGGGGNLCNPAVTIYHEPALATPLSCLMI